MGINSERLPSSNSKEYIRAYMRRYRAEGKDQTLKSAVRHPFLGVDGEGGNLSNCYHAYFLLSAGNARVVPMAGNARLSTGECLAFLCDEVPRDAIPVIYFGDYDA